MLEQLVADEGDLLRADLNAHILRCLDDAMRLVVARLGVDLECEQVIAVVKHR